MQIEHARWVEVDTIRVPATAPPPREDLLERMITSMRDFGQISPVLVSPDGEVLAGRYRAAAAAALGLQLLVRVVHGTDDALEALRVDENRSRAATFGHLATCIDAYALEVWLVARGERATRGRSGVTTAAIGQRLGQSARHTRRYLGVGRALAPDVRATLQLQPDAPSWTLDDLERFATLPPATQRYVAEGLERVPWADALDRVAPVPGPSAESVARAQVRRLEAFVRVAATQGGEWDALGAEAAALLARATVLADAASDAPPPVETPSTPAPAAGTPPETAIEAETPASTVDVGAARPPAAVEPAGSGRRPADIVREALPDVAAALTAGQAALDRARRTGHRPPSTTVAVEARAARVAAVVAPAMGVVADGATVSGPGDAVDVVRVLAEALAPQMRGRAALDRLKRTVDGLPGP